MRLLKLGVYYPAYLRQFYARCAGLESQPYSVQHASLMQDGFGSADFWTTALARLGYETADIIANAAPLQRRWASENGTTSGEHDWLFDITAAQVQKFRPDVIIVADYSTVTAAFLRRLREACPSIRLILGWCGAPYSDPSVFREWDIVLSCIPELVGHFRQHGHQCFHVNHAFDPRLLERLDTTATPTADFTFVGSVLKHDRFHLEREKILRALVEHTGLEIWSDLASPERSERRHDATAPRRWAHEAVQAAQRVGIPQTLLAAVPFVRRAVVNANPHPEAANDSVDARIISRARAPLFGLAMFQQLHDSRVALNTHIDISPASASNMRLFEATGVGACLLTDWKANLSEMFAPETEVVTYRDADECVERVRYLLSHEAERRAIALAGQRRTLRDHTFKERALEIDEIIRTALSSD